MKNQHMAKKPPGAIGTATATNPRGVPSLADYPLLVHAPKQHGEGIRTEDVGASVDEIAAAYAKKKDAKKIAEQFGTTAAHVEQAVKYAKGTKGG
jgi:uncharacterized protein (DUF433 family)